jgi:hypothetical protein
MLVFYDCVEVGEGKRERLPEYFISDIIPDVAVSCVSFHCYEALCMWIN